MCDASIARATGVSKALKTQQHTTIKLTNACIFTPYTRYQEITTTLILGTFTGDIVMCELHVVADASALRCARAHKRPATQQTDSLLLHASFKLRRFDDKKICSYPQCGTLVASCLL